MKLGIVGAGAIGGLLAARLTAQHDVLVLVRTAEARDLLSFPATCEPADLRDRDVVIAAVKAQDVYAALLPLRDVLAQRTLIATISNGLDAAADARRALASSARVIAGSTMLGAITVSPGRVRMTGEGVTTLGASRGGSPSSDELADAFALAGFEAAVVADMRPVLWRKLVINAAINPVAALAGRENGAILADPALRAQAQHAAAEAAAVAAAEGFAVAEPWELVERAAQATAQNRNSMLQDLDAGRPTENDALGGALLRRAARHGLDLPHTAALTARVREREAR